MLQQARTVPRGRRNPHAEAIHLLSLINPCEA